MAERYDLEIDAGACDVVDLISVDAVTVRLDDKVCDGIMDLYSNLGDR
jgi:hypothetical protein